MGKSNSINRIKHILLCASIVITSYNLLKAHCALQIYVIRRIGSTNLEASDYRRPNFWHGSVVLIQGWMQ